MKTKLFFAVALSFMLAPSAREAAAQSPNVVLRYKDVVGTYRDGHGSVITVDRAPGGMVSVEYRGIYKGLTPASVNIGMVRATTKLVGDTATFGASESEECVITFVFKRRRLVAAQKGDNIACGFGHNVNATGTYKLASRRVQKFDEYGEPVKYKR